LWKQFKETSQTVPLAKLAPKATVTIVKKFRYAGEDISQTLEVDADSEDAKKWPTVESTPLPTPAGPEDNSYGTKTMPENLTAATTTVAEPLKAEPSTPAPQRRLGAIRPRKTLGDIPTSKGKKISTLDKSLMDWSAHIDKGDAKMKHDLEAHRRGGGFIEKVEFMDRVSQRRDEELRGSSSKRRRT